LLVCFFIAYLSLSVSGDRLFRPSLFAAAKTNTQ